VEIRKCIFDNDDEIQLLVNLQNIVYKQRGLVFTKDVFDFWYRQNPEGTVISYNAFDEGKMVAHQSFIPERMLVDGRIVKCLRSMAVVTLPDYRGRGLFSQLTNFAIKEAERQGYEFIYAVTNANSFPMFIKYCGFSFVTRLDVKIGVGTNVKEDGDKTYKRYWSAEALKWRVLHKNYFRVGNNILGTYKYWVRTFMGKMDTAIAKSVQIPTKPSMFGPTLYVGLGAKLPKTYMNMPKFVKHSPFNLVFRDLSGGKLPPMSQNNVFYQLIDFDVA